MENKGEKPAAVPKPHCFKIIEGRVVCVGEGCSFPEDCMWGDKLKNDEGETPVIERKPGVMEGGMPRSR